MCVRALFSLHVCGRESERRGRKKEKEEKESGLKPRAADAWNEKPAVVKVERR